jgi:hypothetical protein
MLRQPDVWGVPARRVITPEAFGLTPPGGVRAWAVGMAPKANGGGASDASALLGVRPIRVSDASDLLKDAVA